MDNTLIQQGYFNVGATLAQRIIPVRAGFDWVKVVNYTEYGATSANAGIEFFWQTGMPQGSAIVKYHNSSTTMLSALFTLNQGGIYYQDTSVQTPETVVTGTTIDHATGIFTAASHGYATGDVVRVTGTTTGMYQVQGIDFTITRLGANTFSLTNLLTTPAAFVNATAFSVRRIPFNPIYYPRRRVITAVQAGTVLTTQTLVTMSVTHGYTVGQEVRVNIPSVWGISGLYGVLGVIRAIGEADSNGYTNTITLDIPTSSWSGTFAWPVSTLMPFTYAEIVPVGENVDATIHGATAAGVDTGPLNPNLLDDATRNTAAINLVLGTGNGTISGPAGKTAGSPGDLVFWMAGKNYLI